MNPWEQTENFQGDVKIYYDNLLSHLKKFNNKIFVESGTFLGNGLQCALHAGFEKCYTIEIHPHLYEKVQIRFASEINQNRVISYLGDSGKLLEKVIHELNDTATFWLDAHVSSQYGTKLAKNCPVLEELEMIKYHFIKNHTLLIDDLNCFGRPKHDKITLDQVKNKILEINSNYKFEFLDAARPANILAAFV
jgi:hypothetical protein